MNKPRRTCRNHPSKHGPSPCPERNASPTLQYYLWISTSGPTATPGFGGQAEVRPVKAGKTKFAMPDTFPQPQPRNLLPAAPVMSATADHARSNQVKPISFIHDQTTTALNHCKSTLGPSGSRQVKPKFHPPGSVLLSVAYQREPKPLPSAIRRGIFVVSHPKNHPSPSRATSSALRTFAPTRVIPRFDPVKPGKTNFNQPQSHHACSKWLHINLMPNCQAGVRLPRPTLFLRVGGGPDQTLEIHRIIIAS
jgi:hypothetical protein